jgi:hypothetical protein
MSNMKRFHQVICLSVKIVFHSGQIDQSICLQSVAVPNYEATTFSCQESQASAAEAGIDLDLFHCTLSDNSTGSGQFDIEHS